MQQLIPFVLIIGALYFMTIRPQQQRAKAQRALVSSITLGDEIVTVGGMLGRIVDLTEEDVSVETTPGTVIRVRRAAIAGKLNDDDDAGFDHPVDGADGSDDRL